MRIEESINNLRTKVEGVGAGVAASWDAFKGNTGMIPKEEQTIGNLKYAIHMNQEEMEPNEINFVDFNGMVLSMTIEEVMQLTEMPKPNEYYNLTFEHWTKTLEEIQDGRCHTVGATYHTTDGFNYYVVETTQDGEEVEISLSSSQHLHPENLVYWGDGTYDIAQYSQKHVYEKKGTYIICFKDIGKYTTFWGGHLANKWLKEVYLNERVDRSNINLRDYERMRKISIPDNGTSINFGVYGLDKCKLKSLVISGSYVGGLLSSNYSIPILPNLAYLVLDSITNMGLPSLNDLKCLSIKNVKTVDGYNGTSYGKLKHIVFDNVETIGSHAFNYGGGANENARYNRLSVIDFSDTIQSIANNCFLMGVDTIYIRSITPPTLGGTNVFWGKSWGYKTIIHIRKDATYTDAAGTTYTGLEAYAHATNWATLYADTNYIFIDDL